MEFVGEWWSIPIGLLKGVEICVKVNAKAGVAYPNEIVKAKANTRDNTSLFTNNETHRGLYHL